MTPDHAPTYSKRPSFAERLTGYLRLMRPANIVTAIADILAGIAIALYASSPYTGYSAGPAPLYALLLLAGATACLYGGGVVMNDVFDAALDEKERPERPIPSGLVSKTAASWFGISLLLCGILLAALSENYSSLYSTLIATAIALAALVYDKWSKHHAIAGPLNMGLCRGLNILLGISIVPAAIGLYWWISLAPIVYIAAITMISRGEVHGSRRTTLYLAGLFYNIVIAFVLLIAYRNDTLMVCLPFVIIFTILIFPALQRAIMKPEGPRIGKAVKAGVIGLIALDASWAAAFGDLYFAVLILLLLPVSLLLARLFAVT